MGSLFTVEGYLAEFKVSRVSRGLFWCPRFSRVSHGVWFAVPRVSRPAGCPKVVAIECDSARVIDRVSARVID